MNWETLLCWGDSITIGARSYLAYPEHAGDLLKSVTRKQWHTPIHAKCGFTVCDLNRSLTTVMSEYKAFQPSLLTIMIGTNDLKSSTDVRHFRVAYRQLIIKALMICAPSQVVLLSIPRLKAGVMYPYNMEMNPQVDRYNGLIRTFCEEFGVRSLEFQLNDEDFFDGVHLNESGSRQAGLQLSDFVLRDRGLPAHASNATSLNAATALPTAATLPVDSGFLTHS